MLLASATSHPASGYSCHWGVPGDNADATFGFCKSRTDCGYEMEQCHIHGLFLSKFSSCVTDNCNACSFV